MKCPICGKELELTKKQVGTGENGEPVFNEYAICRDCRKQWNLDKQRAKRAAKKEEEKKAAPAEKPAPEKKPAAEAPVKKPAPKKEPTAEAPAKKPAPKKPAADADEPVKKPVKKKRPRPAEETAPEAEKAPAKKPVRRKRPETTEDVRESKEEKRYSNIPPEKVRRKHGKAARKGYTDMLETGEINKKSKASKKKPQPKPEPQTEEYTDEDYFDDDPRFRPMRVILAILSLAGFGYLIYRGFVTGLADTTEGAMLSSGMTYIIVSLCMLVSALLYFIMLNRNTVFAFLLPMLFYLGGGVFAFLQKGDNMELLFAAVAGAVLAVISLILAITSRGGSDDEEEDYDDAFEDDYADEESDN
ncbi:MAG TPA: hypothetical protein H9765_07800 [Candidatus Mediterraneibacter intestinigallinarum]|nr:hypothetical protein [Candidatus Mediterraneibacter intestinigallinarum]